VVLSTVRSRLSLANPLDPRPEGALVPETAARLREAAYALFEQQGYAATTVDQIGLPPPLPRRPADLDRRGSGRRPAR